MTLLRSEPAIPAILLIGHSNSGKSPLGELVQSWQTAVGGRYHHLDFGGHLRATLARTFDPGLDDNEISFLARVMDGRLLDDEHFSIARKIVRCFLDKRNFDRSCDALVLNGLPRHAGQARDLVEMGVAIQTLVHLDCSTVSAWERKIASEAGSGHEDRKGRDDHAEAIFARKIASFQRETAPLIAHYLASGVPIVAVPVSATTTPREMLAVVARCWEWAPQGAGA